MAIGDMTAENAAAYIVCKCIDDGEPITNIHLQKMLYVLQIDALHTYGEPLFDDEFSIGIWGPEIRCIYHGFSLWGGNHIDRKPEGMLHLVDSVPYDVACRMDGYIEPLRQFHPWEMHDIVRGLWQAMGEGEVIPISLIAEEELPYLSD